MHAYLIARFDMTDPERAPTGYKKYVEAAGPAYEAHEARFLVRGGAIHPMEGEARSRNVVIEFPDLEKARACYESDIYQRARAHRLSVSEGEIVIVQGAVKDRPAPEGGKGYWIARQDVRDPATYKRYVDGCGSVFADHGGVFLVRGGPQQPVEGQARDRNVIIEFPSVQAALDCFHDETYAKAAEHRRSSAIGEIVIVEGA